IPCASTDARMCPLKVNGYRELHILPKRPEWCRRGAPCMRTAVRAIARSSCKRDLLRPVSARPLPQLLCNQFSFGPDRRHLSREPPDARREIGTSLAIEKLAGGGPATLDLAPSLQHGILSSLVVQVAFD